MLRLRVLSKFYYSTPYQKSKYQENTTSLVTWEISFSWVLENSGKYHKIYVQWNLYIDEQTIQSLNICHSYSKRINSLTKKNYYGYILKDCWVLIWIYIKDTYRKIDRQKDKVRQCHISLWHLGLFKCTGPEKWSSIIVPAILVSCWSDHYWIKHARNISFFRHTYTHDVYTKQDITWSQHPPFETKIFHLNVKFGAHGSASAILVNVFIYFTNWLRQLTNADTDWRVLSI